MQETDNTLIAQAISSAPGDLRAFDELVRRHQARVQTNCRYISGDEEDALDLSQEVLVKAYFNLKRFEARSSFSTWINRIKVNHCLNHLRRQKDRVFVDVDGPEIAGESAMQSAQATDAGVISEDRKRMIGEVLDYLPETLRVPLILRDMDGLSYLEIAEELQVGLSAVKMRIKRARSEFRAAYERT